MNVPSTSNVKLSITLDTLTARILKLSSDSQSGIEPTPFYGWWDPTGCQADPAVAPVTHEIPPDYEFQLFHPCPYAFASCIIMASSSCTVHALNNAVFLDSSSVRRTAILAAAVGMHNGSANLRIPQARMFQRFAA